MAHDRQLTRLCHATMSEAGDTDKLTPATSTLPRAIGQTTDPNQVLLHRPVVTGPSSSHRRPPRALFVATLHWASTTRLCLAAARRGLAVAAVVPPGHALAATPGVPSFVVGGGGVAAARRAVELAVRAWRPDVVVPSDDPAVTSLHALYAAAVGPRGATIRALIERSLGDPRHHGTVRCKSRCVAVARAAGIAVPTTVELLDIDHLRSRLRHGGFPWVLKLDGSYGGLGVRVVDSLAAAEQAFAELKSASDWLALGKQSVKYLQLDGLRSRWRQGRPRLMLQAHLGGRPANRAVFCRRGEVLAGLSVEVLQTVCPNGPASVVRIVDSPVMTAAAERASRELGLSGFVGFDFVLDAETGRPVLIEVNPRPTQICHLAPHAGADMIGALLSELAATPVEAVVRPLAGDVVALFPQEIWRDPASPYLRTAHHDVPWDEPTFLRDYALPVPAGPQSWVERSPHHRWFRPRWPAPSVAPVPGDGAGPVASASPGGVAAPLGNSLSHSG